MPDLTPEEREQIYLEEKARREAQLERESSEAPAQSKAQSERQKSEALLRFEREEKEARARLEAGSAFTRAEREAQARKNAQLWLERKEQEEQEKLRLEKWRKGNKRHIRHIALLIVILLFMMNLNIWYLTAPVVLSILFCELLNVRKGWAIYIGVVLFGLLMINNYFTGQILQPVVEEVPYHLKVSREAELAKQLALTPAQQMSMIKIDLERVNLKSSNLALQRAILVHAKLELDQLDQLAGPNRETGALALKIGTLNEALQQKEREVKKAKASP